MTPPLCQTSAPQWTFFSSAISHHHLQTASRNWRCTLRRRLRGPNRHLAISQCPPNIPGEEKARKLTRCSPHIMLHPFIRSPVNFMTQQRLTKNKPLLLHSFEEISNQSTCYSAVQRGLKNISKHSKTNSRKTLASTPTLGGQINPYRAGRGIRNSPDSS